MQFGTNVRKPIIFPGKMNPEIGLSGSPRRLWHWLMPSRVKYTSYRAIWGEEAHIVLETKELSRLQTSRFWRKRDSSGMWFCSLWSMVTLTLGSQVSLTVGCTQYLCTSGWHVISFSFIFGRVISILPLFESIAGTSGRTLTKYSRLCKKILCTKNMEEKNRAYLFA